jgi:predicted transcriptional regulator
MRVIDAEKVTQVRYTEMAAKQVADILGVSVAAVKRAAIDKSRPNNTRLLVRTFAAKFQVDDVLTTNWITIRDNDYRRALNAFAEAKAEREQIYVAHVDEVPSLSTAPHEISEPATAEELVRMWDVLKSKYMAMKEERVKTRGKEVQG